jgi:hypothetical protein
LAGLAGGAAAAAADELETSLRHGWQPGAGGRAFFRVVFVFHFSLCIAKEER